MRTPLEVIPCRGCLGPVDGQAQAGLCGRCWSLLTPLPEERCPLCALGHGWADPCPDPVAWSSGDALWDYHGGLGALLVPSIKRGELGWMDALLERAARAPLPPWTAEATLVCSAPTARLRRWYRGFDLAERAALTFAARLGTAFGAVLRKPLYTRAQASLPQGRRRRMGPHVTLVPGRAVEGEAVLLVDDVWTTGTTLLRSAQALGAAGARDVAVLALFRAGKRG
ncbi:ComF family protein [Mesoterricola silvestris]|uniref:Amidophosphoribosyltransferase n=1 Tax=Mesoterricola silvestris TaxID=2927979 RepID=A0AA48GJS3_9BACT|nr:phosphoribosyltransferase family protein [Mesoterricola silvestris]BDU72459.1 amidophosphoribosyltransferase [Mesoterricola silvestris]